MGRSGSLLYPVSSGGQYLYRCMERIRQRIRNVLSDGDRGYGALRQGSRGDKGPSRPAPEFLSRVVSAVAQFYVVFAGYLYGRSLPVSAHPVRQVFPPRWPHVATAVRIRKPCCCRRLSYMPAYQRYTGDCGPARAVARRAGNGRPGRGKR